MTTEIGTYMEQPFLQVVIMMTSFDSIKPLLMILFHLLIQTPFTKLDQNKPNGSKVDELFSCYK